MVFRLIPSVLRGFMMFTPMPNQHIDSGNCILKHTLRLEHQDPPPDLINGQITMPLPHPNLKLALSLRSVQATCGSIPENLLIKLFYWNTPFGSRGYF